MIFATDNFTNHCYYIMSVIIILLIASISVALLFLIAFLWSVKTGQFEDDYSPSSRILFDDTIHSEKTNKSR